MNTAYQPADEPQEDRYHEETLFAFSCEVRELAGMGYTREQLIAELDRALTPEPEPAELPAGFDPFKAA